MDSSASSNRYDQLERAAYYLWLERGSPFGSPEVDWFHAEEKLRDDTEQPDQDDSALVAVAKAMGSAIGSVASLVESLGALTRESDHKS
jgi:hypothetical protein